tara:strand:- start:1176 stop:1286 length:111 start_codon:yes stop_codon:yes gene_type:complete
MGFLRKMKEMVMDKPAKSAVVFAVGYVVGQYFPFAW